MEDRSHRDDLRVHGVPENAETMHALAFLSDAIPLWFPNLGSVEIMRAHRVGAPKEDTNGRPGIKIVYKIKRTACLDLLRRQNVDVAFIQESHLRTIDVCRFSNKHYMWPPQHHWTRKLGGH